MIAHGKRPARVVRSKVSKGARLSRKALDALQVKMERAMTLDLHRGIEAFQAQVDPSKMEAAVRSGKYASVMRTIPMDAASEVLGKAGKRIGDAATGAAEVTAKTTLPRGGEKMLRFDVVNPAIKEYVNTRIGGLIQNVTDNVQAIVQDNVSLSLTDGLTARDVADNIRSVIGMNDRQAAAYQKFDGGPDEKEAYRQRLIGQRAETVARTEISYALNQGQLSVWSAAADQGILPDDAKKVWIVDSAPCPFICEPMDGVEVGIDEDFTLPDGVTVPGPPAHPCCYCELSLNIGDAPTSGRENFAQDDTDVD